MYLTVQGKKNYIYKLKVITEKEVMPKNEPVPYCEREAVQKEINKMLENDITEPSDSIFSYPLVSKADSSIRVCLDCREIRKVIERDNTQPEGTDQILMSFHGMKYVSSFDLTNGFLQVELNKNSRKYVSFLFTGQNLKYKRLPFGLLNSVSEFIITFKF